jgi:hypothetical protein
MGTDRAAAPAAVPADVPGPRRGDDDLLGQAIELVRLGDDLEPVLRAALALACRRTGFDSAVGCVDVGDPDGHSVCVVHPDPPAPASVTAPPVASAVPTWTTGPPTVVTVPVGSVGTLSLLSPEEREYDATVVAFVEQMADVLAAVTRRARRRRAAASRRHRAAPQPGEPGGSPAAGTHRVVAVGCGSGVAHAIELDVIVEGIEISAAAVRAAEIGCDYAHGYLYARPAPISEIAASLRQR